MGKIWNNGVIILILLGVFYVVFLRECKKPPICPAADEVVIKKAVWDSIVKIASLPPKVKIDTFYKEGKVIYVPSPPIPKPTIDPKDSTIKNYKDSINNKEIKVWVDLKVKGSILDRSWRYIPIEKEINIETTIYVPKIVNVPTPISKRGIFLYGAAGGNKDAFLFGGGVDYITKKNTEFGYIYQRYGNENFHSVKLGIKLGK